MKSGSSSLQISSPRERANARAAAFVGRGRGARTCRRVVVRLIVSLVRARLSLATRGSPLAHVLSPPSRTEAPRPWPRPTASAECHLAHADRPHGARPLRRHAAWRMHGVRCCDGGLALVVPRAISVCACFVVGFHWAYLHVPFWGFRAPFNLVRFRHMAAHRPRPRGRPRVLPCAPLPTAQETKKKIAVLANGRFGRFCLRGGPFSVRTRGALSPLMGAPGVSEACIRGQVGTRCPLIK